MICTHFTDLNINMNILVICRLRTRSTYFLKTMCNHYNLHNYNEDYFTLPTSYSCALQYANFTPIFYQRHQHNWGKYSEKFQERTNNYFTKNNFGIKLFSKMISSHPVFLHSDQFRNAQIMPNLKKSCKLELYDSVYFLDRNLVESVASYAYSLIVGKSIYKEYIVGKIVEFTNNLYPAVNSYILDYLIQRKIEKILLKYNIPYTYLDYNDIPNFLRNYNQSIDMPVDTKYNYKNLIINYDELVNYTNTIYSQLQETIDL